MPPNSSDVEQRIARASAAMDKDSHLKGIVAATQFRALYQRLMARRRGQPVSDTRGGYNKKLSIPKDEALKEYILML
jgi:hypothetical protein